MVILLLALSSFANLAPKTCMIVLTTHLFHLSGKIITKKVLLSSCGNIWKTEVNCDFRYQLIYALK